MFQIILDASPPNAHQHITTQFPGVWVELVAGPLLPPGPAFSRVVGRRGTWVREILPSFRIGLSPSRNTQEATA